MKYVKRILKKKTCIYVSDMSLVHIYQRHVFAESKGNAKKISPFGEGREISCRLCGSVEDMQDSLEESS